MTQQQAEAALKILRDAAYPDAEIVNLGRGDEPIDDDWEVIAGGVQASTLSELVDQLREDFPNDLELERVCAMLEARDDIDVLGNG